MQNFCLCIAAINRFVYREGIIIKKTRRIFIYWHFLYSHWIIWFIGVEFAIFVQLKRIFLRLADLFHLKNFCNHNTQSKCIFWWFSTEKKDEQDKELFFKIYFNFFFALVFFIYFAIATKSKEGWMKETRQKCDSNVHQKN